MSKVCPYCIKFTHAVALSGPLTQQDPPCVCGCHTSFLKPETDVNVDRTVLVRGNPYIKQLEARIHSLEIAVLTLLEFSHLKPQMNLKEFDKIRKVIQNQNHEVKP